MWVTERKYMNIGGTAVIGSGFPFFIPERLSFSLFFAHSALASRKILPETPLSEFQPYSLY